MLTLGPLALTAPWVLLGAFTLPLLWWLLRATPPAPRRLAFPAVGLLFGLRAGDPEVAHSPWWLVLLRLLLALLVLVGLAGPVVNPDSVGQGDGPLVLVVDDTWAAAPTWEQRRAMALNLIARAEREGRPVLLAATAARAEAEAPTPARFGRATTAATAMRALAPKPWDKDLASALGRLDRTPLPDGDNGGGARANVVWLHDGLEAPGTTAFARRLGRLGRLDLRRADADQLPLLLRPPPQDEAGASILTLRVERPQAGESGPPPARQVDVVARDTQGRTLLVQSARLPAGATSAEVNLAPPAELRDAIARLDVAGHAGAAAVLPLGDAWRRPPAGLVSESAGRRAPVRLLDETHYPREALRAVGPVREGSATDLLKRPLSMMVMTDGARPDAEAVATLADWVRRGGTLVRFAGPRLVPLAPDLLPVRLRAGERALGGALSWTAPGRLAPFPADSPFAGLAVDGAEVAVARQVLARPSPTLSARTWAHLRDGTPLVTAAPLGRGRVVLVHVTADPRWSSLAMSGLFVDMLRRLAETSTGAMPAAAAGSIGPAPGSEDADAAAGVRTEADGHLSPWRVLDGFGHAGPPPPGSQPLSPALIEAPRVTPIHPPGLYGPPGRRHAHTLGAALAPPRALAEQPPGAVIGGLSAVSTERDLRPWLLGAALGLALIDMVVGLALRGLLPGGGAAARRLATGAVVALAVAGAALAPSPPAAAGAGREAMDPMTLEAALRTRLAWVSSGDAAVDETARAGLAALTTMLARRTSAELGSPVGVDPARDPLGVFPLLYWPIPPGQDAPTEAARTRLNAYLRGGGMILIDLHDGADAPRALAGVEVPPLVPVPEDHVLTRSFYLLERFPGRTIGRTVWVEQDPVAHDGVASVIMGGHDWAGAWATDETGRALLPTVPGGNRQREMAYRFGINVVLYALTGNYKGDQVHLPAIMERLTN